MKHLLLLSIGVCMISTAFGEEKEEVYSPVSFGRAERINGHWRFRTGDEPEAQRPDFDANEWPVLDLPHDWSIESALSPSLAACTGFLPGGIGWYRKEMVLPAGHNEKKLYLYFEGVYNRSEVFINGHSLGKRPNGYVSFMYDITPYVEGGKENVVAVRVDHSQSADSRWYTGSGIYRDVWLVEAAPVHIAQWGVYVQTQSIKKEKAVILVETEVENGTDGESELIVTQQFVNHEGVVVATSVTNMDIAPQTTEKLTQKLTVDNPSLWGIDHPYLYRLRTTISNRDGLLVDESTTPVGIRSLSFDPDKGFFLNNENLKMKGVCIHHDAGTLGAAVPKEVWRSRLETLRETGCNAIRTTHNAHAPALYTLCDEMGFLVMDEVFDEWEFPKRKWIQGWNVGVPGFQGAYDFFEEWGEKDLADVVRRDRNHASVFAWSIGNEVDYPNDPYSHPVLDGTSISQPMFGGYRPKQPPAGRLGVIAKRLANVVKAYDPSRPVTAGLAGVAMSNATAYPGALDMAGYNYTEDRYVTDHKAYPERVIYGSENRHDMAAWKAVRDNAHIFGQFLWTGIDYLGEAGKWPSRGSSSGLLDLGGQIKPRGHFRKALWSDTPVAYIGTYPARTKEKTPSIDAWPVWNYADGQIIRVVAYTNAAKARLELNGKEVGRVKEYDDHTGVISWDIPFGSGKLEVIGLDGDGRESVRHAIRSSGQPYALVAVPGRTTLETDRGLTRITLQIVDENGVPVILSDDEVTCTIDGPARLLGLENGNNEDMSNCRDAVCRVYNGRLTAYVQSGGESGEATVTFASPCLKAAEVKLNVCR
ncbi:MAG: DUF4982 domain-containing protein [Tannerellaceae bacterium]|jgi:hypothetical protein|nr:DUF4982 domain-containing protein [Tannerellaceae bacterium]